MRHPNRISLQWQREYPNGHKDKALLLTPLQEVLSENDRPSLFVLMAAVGVLLLALGTVVLTSALAINPNTVVRAYRELEIRSVLSTQQGVGTFVTAVPVQPDDAERQRQLDQLVGEFVARAGGAGFSAEALIDRLHDFLAEQGRP